MDSLRVSELAKELGKTSKEVLEKFAEIGIMVKSHSNTVTPVQIRKLKEHLGLLPPKDTAKKAFIVKKSKAPQEETAEESKPKTSSKPTAPQIERVEKVQKVQKIEKVEKPAKPVAKTEERTEEKPVIKKAEKPAVRIERTKIEYKNQKPQKFYKRQ